MPTPIAEAFVSLRLDLTGLGPQIVAATKQGAAQAGQELDKGLTSAAGKAGDNVGKTLTSKLKALTAGGALFSALFGFITKGGQEAESSQLRLARQIEATGANFDDYKDRVEQAIDTQVHFGISANQVRNALTALTLKTQDPIKAIDGLSLATNIARGRNISFEDAVTSVGLLLSGNSKQFLRYGINIRDAAKSQAELTTATTAHERAQERLGVATQRLSDLQRIIADRQRLSASDVRALRDAEQRLDDARRDAAEGGAKNIVDAEQNLSDLRARQAEQTVLSIADLHNLRDAQDALTKAETSRDPEAIAAANQRLSDTQEELTARQQLSVSDLQTLRDAEKAVADARANEGTEGASKVADAEQNLADLRSSQAESRQLSVSEELQLRDAHDEVAQAKRDDAKTSADLIKAQGEQTGAISDVATALEKVRGQFQGFADDQAKTLKGRIAELTAQAKNAADEFGLKFGPALTIVSTAFTILGGVTSTASLAMGTSLLPILGTLLIPLAAVAAAAALVVVVIKNWDTIKEIVGDVAGFVKDHLAIIGEAILVLATGGLGGLVIAVVKNFDTILRFLGGLPGRIASLATGMWDGISEAFKAAINFIIRGWNAIEFTIPGFKVGPVGFGGFTLGVPDIPELASGGITTGKILAMVGDNPSGREAIIPLDSNAGRQALGGPSFGPGSVVVSFEGVVPTEAEAFRTGQAAGKGIADALTRRDVRLAMRVA